MEQRLYEALRSATPQRRRLLLSHGGRYANAPLCEDLIRHGFELRDSDPAEHLWAEEVAVEVAEELARRGTACEALRGRAWGHLGNAQRILGEHRSARVALRQAAALIRAAGPELRALIHEFRASLAESVRDLGKIRRHLRAAARLRSAAGDLAGVSKVLIQLGIYHHHLGENETAVRCFYEALGLLPTAPPDIRLARSAIFSLAWCLVDAGQPEEARDRLRRGAPLLESGGDAMVNRLDWIGGKIETMAGAFASARGKLERARRRFASLGLMQEAALTTLDLAITEASAGKIVAMRRHLRQVERMMRATGATVDALAARLLREASEAAEGATAAVLLVEAAALFRHPERYSGGAGGGGGV